MAKYFLHYYYYSLVYSLYYRLVPDKRGGAIAVLFLFVIMLINIRLTDIIETGRQYTKNIPLALAVSGLFVYEFFNILPSYINSSPLPLDSSYLLSLLKELVLTINNFSLSSEPIHFYSVQLSNSNLLPLISFNN